MTPIDFLPALFSEVDDQLRALPTPPEARLWPSEGVTLGLLQALQGGGHRAFDRWLTRDSRALFPQLPERPRLLRLCRTPQDGTQVFWAAPPVLGVLDPAGLELIHPRRAGRSPHPIGRKGLAHPRGMVGGTLWLRRNQWGVIVAWEWATAHGADQPWQWRMRPFEERRIV